MRCVSKKRVLCITCCLIFLILAAGCTSGYRGNLRDFYLDFSYSLSVSANEPISNVTFYIPLPVKNGVPMVGPIVLDETDFARQNISVEIVASPPGLANLTGVYPFADNEPRFLKISADRLFPDARPDGPGPYQLFYLIKNRTNLESSLSFIDTANPYSNETVFLPKLNFTLPAPTPDSSLSDSIYYSGSRPKVLEEIPIHGVPIYTEYSASPTTEVRIVSSIENANRWMDRPIGGGGNFYHDDYVWHRRGESHGWQTAIGYYEPGVGDYPNYDHPAWREVLARMTGELIGSMPAVTGSAFT